MPLYTFSHPETGETVDLIFGMNDEKKYTDEDAIEWKREFSTPQVNGVGSIDPWDNKSFIDGTKGKGTMGDLFDRSSELSQKRADQNGGVDPIKEKVYKKYSKERNGAVHPDKLKKSFDSKDIRIDL
jgi:hypothetical protein